MTELSIPERQALGRLALQVGISSASRETGRNRRTTRRWKQRIQKGQPVTSRNAALSLPEKTRLLQAAPRTRHDSLDSCRRRAGVHRSRSTLSRLYRKSDLVMPEILLTRYRVSGTRKRLTVISIHYSVPRICTTPWGPARRIGSVPTPFYTPRKSDCFLYQGVILPISDPRFERIAPHLGPRDDCTAWFFRAHSSGSRLPWHIISEYRGNLPVSFCGIEFSPYRPGQSVPPMARRQSPGPICHKCTLKMIPVYQRRKNLKPVQLADPDPGFHGLF